MKKNFPATCRSTCSTSVTIALIIGLTFSPAWASPITGDAVTGDLTIEGEAIRIDNGINQFALNLGTKRIDFWHDEPGQWVWSHGATPTDVMSLDTNNNLSLYDLGTTSVNPSIILRPGNPLSSPVILPSIMIGGNPVITSANTASILGSQGYLRVVGGVLQITSSTSSTSSTSGALTVAGGLGVAKDTWINGIRIGKGGGNITSNTGVGSGNLNSNITGGASNSAFGFEALYGNITGTGNTATGHLSLNMNSYGWYNSALGSQSLRYQINGNRNVAVGYDAGSLLEDGSILSNASDSVFIGARTRAKVNSAQNSIVIGYNAIGKGSNTTVIGNDATVSTHLRGETNVSALRVIGSVVIEQPQGDISMGEYQ